uniref:Uncharacterized protein n=1 Tax=Mustela putorius furo TaxID=9669 RepID=M3YDU0_MUSPF
MASCPEARSCRRRPRAVSPETGEPSPPDRSVRPEACECVAQNQGHDRPPTARPKTGAALRPEVAEGGWSLNSKTTPTDGLAASENTVRDGFPVRK